jgi:hypothetical protein
MLSSFYGFSMPLFGAIALTFGGKRASFASGGWQGILLVFLFFFSFRIGFMNIPCTVRS